MLRILDDGFRIAGFDDRSTIQHDDRICAT